MYERTQHARWMWFILLAALPLVVAWGLSPSIATLAPAIAVVVPIVAILAIFARLTIHVDGEAVSWYMGWGWPAGAIALRDIAGAELTSTNFLEGWGIHYTIWHGWLWNVGGFRAVEITKTDGRRVTLGTDDPQGLLQAIERFRQGAA
ncbi:MAG TPA: hypothetical protein VMF11_01070 [Candidatus Baltobacteraceae bacterium]|nr:hypothetical protein [Candidatus Baltobacteraceae bacterium]